MSKGWRFSGNEAAYVNEVLQSGFAAAESGTFNERLERAFAEKMGARFGITANSGTSTLHMALRAFGVGPGDEVIIPALTVAMCGFAVWQAGATAVYADVDPDTFLLDPRDFESKITERTKAVMPVHLYGAVCDMKSILEIASRHKIPVIEDCAQCFMATDAQGRIAGNIGDVGSWSFENSKHMSCGDGGIVTTNNENFAVVMRQFGGVGFQNLTATSGKVRISRDRFQDPRWERHNIMAYNYRLPEICAAVALAQLERLDHFVELRVSMGKAYGEVIARDGRKLLKPQTLYPGHTHSYYTYAAQFLGEEAGIEWQTFRKKYIEFGGDGIYAAWQTVNNEPAFRGFGRGAVPVAERLQKHMMQFTANQKDESERSAQAECLSKTLRYFS